MKAICTLCNFVVEEADKSQSLKGAATTGKFDHLPEDWKCPGCSAAKEFLQTCSCVSLATSGEATKIAAHKCA